MIAKVLSESRSVTISRLVESDLVPWPWILGGLRANLEVIRSNPGGNRLLAPVVQKGSPAAAASRLLSIPNFCFFAGQPAYLLTKSRTASKLLPNHTKNLEFLLSDDLPSLGRTCES